MADRVGQTIVRLVACYLASGVSCPCPYSVTHDGHACGKRSALAKMGAMAPRCYADETAAQLAPPAITRRPESAFDGEEAARSLLMQASWVMIAGLVDME